MIGTVFADTIELYYNQHELLESIIEIHLKPRGMDRFELDATYSTGKFYQHGVPEPFHRFDADPDVKGVVHADCADLPLPNNSVGSAILDLPYLHATGKDSIMGNRFGSFPSQAALRAKHQEALSEYQRVVRRRGVVVVKCQDIVESGKQNFNHIRIFNMAEDLRYTGLDQFLLGKKGQVTGHNWAVQKHGRKQHAFFLVFER